MKAFHFRLESVLTLRSWDEERARTALSQALAQEHRFEQALSELETMVEQCLASWMAEREAGGPAAREVGQWAHLNYLDRNRRELEERLVAAQRVRDERTRNLLECRQQRRVIEKLKERHHDAFRKDLQGRLEHEIEDLFNARFNRGT
ncbi:MAG: hypothetical protein DRP71_02460 [Verrucomicrobia bacterium]|nr:MAG: hypothetical protein DRP71_02460 [Verrucomicrobiota bacterium]